MRHKNRVAMIGSRKWVHGTKTGAYARAIGQVVVSRGDVVVTGGAPGFDQQSAIGGASVNSLGVKLWVPTEAFERPARDALGVSYQTPDVRHLTSTIPLWNDYAMRRGIALWDSLKFFTKQLQARNYALLLDSDECVAAPDFDADDAPTGGTAFGIFLAEHFGMPLQIIRGEIQTPGWDICRECNLPRELWNCGSQYHQLKAYA